LMSWYFTKCPQSGTIQYEFQEGAHIWWSSLWLRNSRIPIEKVEVKSKNHQTFFPLTRGTDGTLTDSGGFGEGRFTLRATAVDGQVVEDIFDSFPTGEIVPSSNQFK
jgi:expansin (peptidoglycan-binding protein)